MVTYLAVGEFFRLEPHAHAGLQLIESTSISLESHEVIPTTISYQSHVVSVCPTPSIRAALATPPNAEARDNIR